MQVWTTLKKLRKAGACKDRYAHLRKCLGNGYGDDTPIDICAVLHHNGLDDALWIPDSALTGEYIEKRHRLYAVACCQNIWHLLSDHRNKDVVVCAHLYAHGEASVEELAAARDAAWAAARDAAWDAARAWQAKVFKTIFSADFI